MKLNDLERRRIVNSVLELNELDPAIVEELLASPKHGPLLRQALADRVRWSCPLCQTSLFGPERPKGWLIVTPFTRVAACDKCRPVIDAGHVVPFTPRPAS